MPSAARPTRAWTRFGLRVERLSLVDNARGGVDGELASAIGRRRGSDALRALRRHGRAVRDKRAQRKSLTVPVEASHLNDRPPALASLAGGAAPLVATPASGEATLVLGPGDLEPLGGEVPAILAALESRPATLDLELPS